VSVELGNKYLSIEEAANIIGISPRTLRRHIKQGEIFFELDRGNIVFTPAQIDEFMEKYYKV
jgi:excisionase family DNA binding protein